MSPIGGVLPPTSVEVEDQCSFGVEYNGTPVAFRIPQAVPINVDRIPVAAVVSQFSRSETLGFPVVHPIFGPEMAKFSKDVMIQGCDAVFSSSDFVPFAQSYEIDRDKVPISGADGVVSPTSVISFDEDGAGMHDCSISGDLSVSDAVESFDTRGEGVVISSTCGGTTSTSCDHSFEWVGKACSSLNSYYFEGSQSSGAIDVSHECKENQDFSDTRSPEWSSSRSALILDCPSSTSVSSLKVDDRNNESEPIPFEDPIVGIWDEDAASPGRKHAVKETDSRQKKGSCYRCLRGNRFTEKEVCIVCDAKYCSNCVLRSMGSMPEGRKCVTCIGSPIDESKRGMLGKHPRVLKKLLDRLEVRQIMKAEKFGEVNQLPPEYVFVNKKPLSQDEIVLLQSCPNPPKRLKPGGYWYDKVSGLWGKEGQKPCQIISPCLNVGGIIEPNASNGNTDVFINGREITKIELRMLQLSGVQCAGNPHFWVNEDGSYQEEGQKNTKGYIWGKTGSKLICTFLSLPVPSKSANAPRENANHDVNRIVPDYFEQKMVQKFLLVGNNGSGTSTIFKQAKILYKSPPFSDVELDNMKMKIQISVYGYLGILLDGREHLEDERLKKLSKICESNSSGITAETADINPTKTEYSIGPRLKSFADWLLKNIASETSKNIFIAATREYAPLVEELWNDPAIQATYNRRFELQTLPKHSYYFLERAVEILKTDYKPSNLDILRAEGVTASSGLSCVDFTFPDSEFGFVNNTFDQHDLLLRYQLIRFPSRKMGEKWKVLDMFDDVRMIILCISSEEYDEFSKDEEGVTTNKMLSNKACFENMVTHPSLAHLDFLLLLTKFDILESKLHHSPLSTCPWFADFQPVSSHNHGPSPHTTTAAASFINYSPSIGQLAFHYIAAKFKRLYASLTGRKLYVSLVTCLDAGSVDSALKFAGEMVKWDDEKLDFLSTVDYSGCSPDESFLLD